MQLFQAYSGKNRKRSLRSFAKKMKMPPKCECSADPVVTKQIQTVNRQGYSSQW